MRTPAAAFAWQFGRGHRWGAIGLLATIAALGSFKLAVLTSGWKLDVTDITFALLVPLPLAATFLYLLAVFTFGVSGDIAARESMYPPRMLALPVSSAALAGWPMLYGCVSMVLLWFAIRATGMFPSDVYVPTYWPAMFAAALLAWAQALTWMPYPLRGMRIVVSIALMLSIDVVVFTALERKPAESTMLLLLAPWVPPAYFIALTAVRRARRGEIPQWGRSNDSARDDGRSVAAPRFRSTAAAQLWFEWRQYGRSLPTLVAIVLPFGLSLLFLFHETPAIVVEIVVISLLLPAFLAIFVAATVSRSSSNLSESHGMTAFVATRPLEDRDFVVAKWKAAFLSTLAAWLIVAVAVPVALSWSNATEPVLDIVRTVDSALGRPRTVALGMLILAALVGATWKQLVQGLYIGLSGKEWAVKGVTFATLTALTLASFALVWIFESRFRVTVLYNAIPWLLATFVALKLVIAMWVMKRGAERRLFTPRQLVLGAVGWDIAVLSIYGILAWILPEILVRRHLLLLIAMFVVPFTRLAAAPLAVAENRHR